MSLSVGCLVVREKPVHLTVARQLRGSLGDDLDDLGDECQVRNQTITLDIVWTKIIFLEDWRDDCCLLFCDPWSRPCCKETLHIVQMKGSNSFIGTPVGWTWAWGPVNRTSADRMRSFRISFMEQGWKEVKDASVSLVNVSASADDFLSCTALTLRFKVSDVYFFYIVDLPGLDGFTLLPTTLHIMHNTRAYSLHASTGFNKSWKHRVRRYICRGFMRFYITTIRRFRLVVLTQDVYKNPLKTVNSKAGWQVRCS